VGEVSASRPGPFLPLGRTLYPLCRRLCGPQSRSGQVRKISPTLGFHPRTVQPVASRLILSAHRKSFINFKDLSLLTLSFVTHSCRNYTNILGNLKDYACRIPSKFADSLTSAELSRSAVSLSSQPFQNTLKLSSFKYRQSQLTTL
jgi:hypothetical protein